ncbi:MAG: TlpA family protein disulfide reductase [Flavobacteriaceae bacterium]|nr:TlpA family protein disulfide reductase [Flavobacteriaceae bacterium]
MKISKRQRSNIIFIVILALLLIPQTRKPIQIFINKGLALFGPSVEREANRIKISDYGWELNDITTNVKTNFKNSEGKAIVINFWATWCPPCIAEMPSLKKLYVDYKDNVDFYFVSNEKPEVIQAFLEKHDYNFRVHNPLTKYPEQFDISSIPRTFLIDKQGTIVIDKTGAANWNSDKVRSTIDELLN